MKISVISLFALLSLNAFAITSESPWEKIFGSNAEVDAEYNYLRVVNGLELDNICLTSTTLETISPIPVCLKYEEVTTVVRGKGGEISKKLVCSEMVNQKISRSREFENFKCLTFKVTHGKMGTSECVEWTNVPMTLPEVISAKVTYIRGKNTYNFQKDFAFPDCVNY